MSFYLAVDIGASSGRHIVGWREKGEIKTKEIYRFPNGVKEVDGHLTWDIAELLGYVKAGIEKAKELYIDIYGQASAEPNYVVREVDERV